MNIKLFKQCWRVALKAYNEYTEPLPERIQIANSFISDLMRLDRTARRLHKFADKLNNLPKRLSAPYQASFQNALSAIEKSVVECNKEPPDKKYWVPNFTWGLYQLASKEAVKIGFEGGPHMTFIVEDVIIEDVDLGDFKVKVSLVNPCEIKINSLTYGNLETPHPHVRNSDPCLGDAEATLINAWDDGDIASIGDILDAYLRSYQPESAYAHIEEIFGYVCTDCGHQDESMDICEGCDRPSCCQRNCERCFNDFYRCGDCLDLATCESCKHKICKGCCYSCMYCDNTLCEICISTCAECGESFCESCMTDNNCNECASKIEEEAEEEEADVATE